MFEYSRASSEQRVRISAEAPEGFYRGKASPVYRSVELFSGCGGLALGLGMAGFMHEILVERDRNAYATLEHNKRRSSRHVTDWKLEIGDVRNVDWAQWGGVVDLVAGGPPCQPFSVGGKAAGNVDERDMWPEAIRAVREIEPLAFVFENVRGLLRPRFASYVGWIRSYLEHPKIEWRKSESHESHHRRLAREREPQYRVQVLTVNAADYGAPQKRHRILLIGIRNDVKCDAIFPNPTHSQARLVWDKWISGDYWRRHKIAQPKGDRMPRHEAELVRQLRNQLFAPHGLPWVTCRDAFRGLGEPGAVSVVANHKFQAGARPYPGHTGSQIDEPAKALKAGVHGVPGGENMLLLDSGLVRYFTVREAARLQGFPDDFEFPCSWTESMRQLGNAVPVHLARFVGDWLLRNLYMRSYVTV